MTYYMLFDWEKKDVDFIPQKIGFPLEMRFSKKRNHKFLSWFNACCSILKESKKNDCIICWFDLQGIILYWLTLLTFRKRNICCVNLMLKDKKSFKNKVLSFCYRVALKSNRVRASVTSEEYGTWLKKKLRIEKKFFIIRDVYRDIYTVKFNYEEKKQVFVGGVNGRDWDFVFSLAKAMEDIPFCIIVNHETYQKYVSGASPNVELLENVPLSTFEKKMCESSIVCLPLNTEAPSGLIVLFRAAANDKMVCITKTMTSVAYVNKERGCSMDNSIEDWSNEIRYHLENRDIRKGKAENLHKFLTTVCSEDFFVSGLRTMIYH